MELIFWLTLSCFLYSYLVYPVLICLLSLIFKREVSQKDIEPAVSFIIAAYNEEKNIIAKIDNTLSFDYPKEMLEIIVASDGSSDRTDSLVSEYPDPKVKLLRVEGRLGKTETQNVAAAKASGEILLFSDAASMYQKDAIRKIVRNFHDPEVGGVGGRCAYIVPSAQERTGKATQLFWWLESLIKASQSKIKTLTGTSGLIYAVRKELYTPLPPHVISDLVEPIMIAGKHKRFVYEPGAVAYEYTTSKLAQEFSMRVRVISRGMAGILFARTMLNPFKYPWVSFQLFSHKIMRWFVPLYLVVLFATNFALLNKGSFYQALFTGQCLLYLAALFSFSYKINKGPLHHAQNVLLYFITVSAASLTAMFKVIKGETPTTWETDRAQN